MKCSYSLSAQQPSHLVQCSFRVVFFRMHTLLGRQECAFSAFFFYVKGPPSNQNTHQPLGRSSLQPANPHSPLATTSTTSQNPTTAQSPTHPSITPVHLTRYSSLIPHNSPTLTQLHLTTPSKPHPTLSSAFHRPFLFSLILPSVLLSPTPSTHYNTTHSSLHSHVGGTLENSPWGQPWPGFITRRTRRKLSRRTRCTHKPWSSRVSEWNLR